MEGLTRALVATVVLIAAAGCDGATTCATDFGCAAGETCSGGLCVPRSEVDAGGIDAAASPSDARVDARALLCPSMTLCGSPAACCAGDEECIEGACVPACASSVRCGAARDVCCDAGEVCIDATCIAPGIACTDSFNCGDGQFCEPTIGRCLPQFDPVTCETEPVFGDFAPIVEWSRQTATEAPDCMDGITPPIVVDLDGDSRPEIVVNFACSDTVTRGVLRAFRGDGTPYWTVDDVQLQLNGRTSIAAADIDGDGRPEIIGVSSPSTMLDAPHRNRIIAFDDDGTLAWRSRDPTGIEIYQKLVSNGAPTIADLDGDDDPEIIFGALVLNSIGIVQWERDRGSSEGSPTAYTGGISAVADIDLDGEPEIVTGLRAYEANGDPVWDPLPVAEDGYPAIAQFDDDPQPEVVLVGAGNLYLIDGLTGVVQWGPYAIPGGGYGGPPTVADFDGDGLPEIGVAGVASYSVIDPNEAVPLLWSNTTQDVSGATGSSVFDFEGDGAAEVVYGDECYLRVYRGSDGAVLLQEDSSSATIHEYPLVADVDSDGNSEIVLVANNRSPSTVPERCLANDASWTPRNGLYVYGDTRDQWMRTRRVWNQHAYHVTNIAAHSSVPVAETNNWSVSGLNNYRQNVQGEGVYNAPDLAVLAVDAILNGCPWTAILRARIANEGNLGVAAGVPVSFYTGSPGALGTLLGTVRTTESLIPGASTLVELTDVDLVGDPPYSYVAVVDDDGSAAGVVTECDEANNDGSIAGLDCELLF